MNHYFSRKTNISFESALEKVESNLQQQGFGVITSIDLKETLKNKLNINFRKYKIIGACHPEFAFKAISLESHIGLMLPCNIVVQEHENGEVEISAVNPLDNIERGTMTTQLTELATEVGNRLRTAIDNLERDDAATTHNEALPTEAEQASLATPE